MHHMDPVARLGPPRKAPRRRWAARCTSAAPLVCPVGSVLPWLVWLLLWRGAACVSPASSRILEEVERWEAAAAAAAAPSKMFDFQGAALVEFASVLSDPHETLLLWTDASHPCGGAAGQPPAWPGVECDEPLGSVLGIDLSSRGLGGQLGPSLASIETLRSIDLHNNSLTGDLPAAWSALQLLGTLDVSSNALDGTLPPAYSGLGALHQLDAARNRLRGPLPPAWSGMSLLEVLDLSHNRLTGTLPETWGRLAFLATLALRDNALTGSLPAEWAAQIRLLQLDAADNRIAGALPEAWAQGMDLLRSANLTNNSIAGALPEPWANLTSLRALSIGSNNLSGSIPATWSSLPLHSLQIGSNGGVCGDIPTGVRGALAGGATGLNGSCAWDTDAAVLLAAKASLGDPREALASWQPGTNPCGAARPWAGAACDADGRVSGVLLPAHGLQGQLPARLWEVERLQEINFAANQLTGTLPDDWSRQPRLRAINVSANALSGTLPESWGPVLGALQRLDASGNGGLAGTLPKSWAGMGALEVLSLGGNALEGSIPDSWASTTSLHSLQVLRLDDNRLNGPLPAAGLPPAVREVRLRGNALEGSVPPALVDAAPRLSILDLDGNQQLCGALPPLPAGATVRSSLTQLGAECRAPPGTVPPKTLATIVGATAGTCCLLFAAGVAVFVATRKHISAGCRQPGVPPAEAAAGVSVIGVPVGHDGSTTQGPHPTGPTQHEACRPAAGLIRAPTPPAHVVSPPAPAPTERAAVVALLCDDPSSALAATATGPPAAVAPPPPQSPNRAALSPLSTGADIGVSPPYSPRLPVLASVSCPISTAAACAAGTSGFADGESSSPSPRAQSVWCRTPLSRVFALKQAGADAAAAAVQAASDGSGAAAGDAGDPYPLSDSAAAAVIAGGGGGGSAILSRPGTPVAQGLQPGSPAAASPRAGPALLADEAAIAAGTP